MQRKRGKQHNGAGKSTTIETILGLKKADSGKATILGMNPLKQRKQIFEKVGVQLQCHFSRIEI